MWDIVFKDHNGRKAPRNAEGSDFHEVMHPDIGKMTKKKVKSSRKVREVLERLFIEFTCFCQDF